MVSVWDVPQNVFVEYVAEELKQNDHIKPPVWAVYVKTGVHKERPPSANDWWYKRTASILKNIYKLGPVGVSKLRTKYGGKQRRGVASPKFKRGAGKIIRTILQQLEKTGYIKQVEKGLKKGRIITPHGKSFLEKIATKVSKSVGRASGAKETLKLKLESSEAKEHAPSTPSKPEEKIEGAEKKKPLKKKK